MTKKDLFDLNSNFMRITLIILGSIFSTLVLSFSVLAITKIQAQDLAGASGFMVPIFIVLALARLVAFVKERTKMNFIRFAILFVLDIALGITIYFGKDNPYLYSLCGGLFCVTVIISRGFKIIINHSVRSIVLNCIIMSIMTILALGLFTPVPEETPATPIMIVCFIVAVTSLTEVLSGAFSQLKVKTLISIIIRTYALEIILGLITLMVAAAIIFMSYEDTVASFGDGLWYAFAIVTTIGFGDIAAHTIIGRIASVILGVYGIVVVAVITSIIVNFYNETSGKKDAKEFKKIEEKTTDNKKKK